MKLVQKQAIKEPVALKSLKMGARNGTHYGEVKLMQQQVIKEEWNMSKRKSDTLVVRLS